MIEDKIAKRFQFDLEMGIFNHIPDEDTCAFYPIYDKIKMHRFAMMLEELDFKENTFYTDKSLTFVGISVSNKDKTYWYFEEDINNVEGCNQYDNEVPDYLYEYDIGS